MDNNTSPTPDPDATTRRRSGRVVRAPAKFTPEPATQSTHPKRKRDDQDDDEDENEDEEEAENETPDSDEEMSDESDNDSDEDHPAPRSRKKPSQTSRAKKPSAKKPKTNGSKPLRPARVTHAAKSLPSRPKKSVRIEDAAVKGTGLYSDLFGSGDSSKSVAEEWLTRYKTDSVAAVADLVNCILQCAGCDQLITEDDVRDLDNVAGRLADLQSVYQEQQITDYPLISRTKHSRSFRDVLITFFENLIVDMHQGRLMYADETFIDNLHTWLASMSSSSLRPFRHTATTISLAVQSALVMVANDLDFRLGRPGQNAKGKSNTDRRDTEQNKKDRKVCTDAIQSFFDTVFVHRYRDVDPKIRTECVEALGNWIISLPAVFLEPGYLRYLGWMLSDTNAPTRHEVLKQLTKVFRREASKLGHFIDRFRPRLVEMACKDSDVSVRVAAIGVIDVLRDQDLLEGEEVDAIGKLIFDNELRIRKAVVAFFVACTEDAISEKTKSLRDSEVIEDIPRGKKASLDMPRMEWVDLKCLAETLAIYDNQIEEEHQSGQLLGLDVAVDLLESAVPETRISLAAQVLFEKVDAIKQWTLLAGYLLFDHTTSSKARSKGNNPDLAFKKAVAPTPPEESILLDVLSSAVKSSLTHAPEHDRSRKKPHTSRDAEDVRISPEDTAAELVTVIPPLLSKFGAEPDTAAIVLRLAHLLNLEVFKQLRQNTNRYEKLLDEIITQFNRHDDKRVLSEATAALLHSRQYDELEELTESKLSNLWETVTASLHKFDKTYELSSRGNLGEGPLRELSTVLLKISKLASISDCIDVLEAGEDSESAITPVVKILANIVHRGKYEPLDDQDIDDLEDEVVSFAVKTCQFYFMWKTRAYSKLLSTGGSIADAELDRLSVLRQTFRRHLIETLSSRAAIDQLRLFATGSLCDLHLTFATLRPTIDRLRPSSSSETQSSDGEKYKVLVQEIESGLIPELIAIFDGTEKQYAKKIKKDKSLNEPAEDEDPVADDEDEEDEDEDEGLSEEERFAAELKAEKALCELTAKYVLVITARLVDNKGSHAGKLRRRLLRNQNKLGNNFKEVVTYLDEEKLAERTRKKAAHVQASTAKPQKAQLSEAIVLGEDDEDDIFDDTPEPEEGSRKDLRAKGLLEDDPIEDDDENEDEEAERPAHESDDEVLGD
ncbi:cohesin complex subunit SA-1/2 [Fusarium austroafricanum]|uniref:Cohesin complex subunit SA-1/2 n=1 Tax=Fusarium austroafricanum TaxID=2364996 RepID=A0A8H4KLS2_9HYPO|nr:cohesin complex subunit SA-1/2 [Fusarium austroafricanum]